MNQQTDKWTAKAAMPSWRFGAAVAVVKDVLYVVGGQGKLGWWNVLDTMDAIQP